VSIVALQQNLSEIIRLQGKFVK